jgi:hypothetical protein
MRYARIALLSAVATALLSLAPPAFAELGHPSGCLSCSPVEVAGPTEGYYHEGGSGSVLSGGFLPGGTALTPETDAAAAPKIRHKRHHARRAVVR